MAVRHMCFPLTESVGHEAADAPSVEAGGAHVH